MFRLAISVLLFVLVGRSCDGAYETMDVFRLPKTTVPKSYNLRIVPQFDGNATTFTGVVEIVLNPMEPVDEVTLNLKDLNVTDVVVQEVTNKPPRDFEVKSKTYVPQNEQFVIKLEKPLVMGMEFLVKISYVGKARHDLTGFYLSSYDVAGVTKWLAVTQFEPTFARRAFPCYDEPSYKAVFTVSVVKQKNQTALSNMPIERVVTNKLDNTETVYFQQTPQMSTYLLAFYVGEFVANKNDSEITVYTHEDYLYQTKYVENEAPKHLKVLKEYTEIPCSIDKLDLLAIPDFSFGAMENWGINTFREYYLLLHPESKTILKMRSSIVMQHEFTHQWFGNLVTCAWWDYLWLNEGFARYFQYFLTGTVRSTWKMDQRFVVEAHQYSLAYDQTPRHPITASVNTPEEIENLFDLISYSKAASVLRMLRYLITEEFFKLSLHNYLDKKKYAAAEPKDLFIEIDTVLYVKNYTIGNNLNVITFMTNWTTQAGYPVLDITKNETSNTYSITQSRFLIDADDQNDTESSPAWHVGLTYTTKSSRNFTNFQPAAWTNQTLKTTVIPAARDSGWYIFNIQSSGFYRVNYDGDNWMALIGQLNENRSDIHVLNRAQLIDDSFALAKAGRLDYAVPLRLSNYLKNEDDVMPWYSAMNAFAYLVERMPRNQIGYEKIKAHVGKLAGTIYKKLEDLVSKNNTEFNTLSAWDSFSSWACKLDNEECTTKALEYFNNWKTGKKIPADIKDAAFCVGVKKNSTDEIFNKMLNLYKTTDSISEKLSAESALGCSTNRDHLVRYVNYIFDGSQGPIKARDYNSVMSAVSVTPLGLDVLYELLNTKLDKILNEIPDGEAVVTHIYSTLASKMTSDDDILKIKYLKDNSTLPVSVKSSFDKSFEKVNSNLLWFNKYSEGINQWAIQNEEEEKQKYTSPKPTSAGSSAKPLDQSTVAPTTDKPKPSSAPSIAHNSFLILQLSALSVLIKMCTS